MELAIENYFSVSYRRLPVILNPVIYYYFMNGCLPSRRKESYVLGVTLDEGLNFNVHIDNTLSKAFKLFGFIIIQTRGYDPLCLKSLFTGLVRSCVEYCSVV